MMRIKSVESKELKKIPLIGSKIAVSVVNYSPWMGATIGRQEGIVYDVEIDNGRLTVYYRDSEIRKLHRWREPQWGMDVELHIIGWWMWQRVTTVILLYGCLHLNRAKFTPPPAK